MPAKDDYLPLFSTEYTPNSSSLRGISIVDLYRAYSIGSIVCVTGSGATRLLGYPDWKQFAKKTAQQAATAINSHIASETAAGKVVDESVTRLAKTISELLGAHDVQDPLAFLTLATEVAELNALEVDPTNTSQVSETLDAPPSQASSLRRTIFDSYRKQFLFPQRFTVNDLANLKANSGIQNCSDIRSFLDEYKDRLLPVDVANGLTEFLGKDAFSDPVTSPLAAQILTAGRPTIDIYAQLVKQFGASRFVTYNYDLELERTLEHFDFPIFSLTKEKSESRGRLGVRGRSLNITSDNAAELFSFAANYPAAASQVLHLHGSVKNPATIVATDRDYNNRYARNSVDNSLLEDAQDLLFRGNAILFIGVGMTEDDMLRPLRFLTFHPDRNDRPIFALLPANSDQHQDTTISIKLFHRYGVRSIFYGTKLNQPVEGEFGDFQDHPLYEDFLVYYKKALNKTCPFPPGELGTLREECNLLESIEAALRLPVYSSSVTDAEQTWKSAETVCRKETAEEKVAIFRKSPHCYPRLACTRWYRNLFIMLLDELEDSQWNPESEARERMRVVCERLRDAMRARALSDALEFLTRRARQWRLDWSKAQPSFRTLPKDGASSFTRHCAVVNPLYAQDKMLIGRIREKLGKHQIWQLNRGVGEGTLASLFGQLVDGINGPIIISFSQSCEFDSPFDAIRNVVVASGRAPGAPSALTQPKLEVVLSKVDLIMDGRYGVPKLYEWHKFFSEYGKVINFHIFCNRPETSKYFQSALCIDPKEVNRSCDVLATLEPVEPASLPRYLRIVSQQYSGSRHEIESRLEYLGLTAYQPRPELAVLDAVIEDQERQAVADKGGTANKDDSARLLKVLAHVILKQLFAFGIPVGRSTLMCCPEFVTVYQLYSIGAKRGRSLDAAIKDLVDRAWIIELCGGRYGLHSDMRRYLTKKKGLPYAYVEGREQCALTMASALAEENVVLERDESEFIYRTVNALLDASERPGPDRHEHIRAAFGMLRGSMRVAVALRCAHGVSEGSNSLEIYFRALLRVRKAIIMAGSSQSLYEREWVWLFNELGVVRLLQGNIHDALPLLEQALSFERVRLADGLHSGRARLVPSIRIMINIASACVEKGALTAVERIVGECREHLSQMLCVSTLPALQSSEACESSGPEIFLAETHDSGQPFQDINHPEIQLLRVLLQMLEAQMEHLRGRAVRSLNLLNDARSAVASSRLQGVISWAHRLRIDVAMLHKNLSDVEWALAVCRSTAAASGRPDTILSSQLVEVSLSVDAKDPRGALLQLEKILRRSIELGLARSRITALILRAKVKLRIGALSAARADVVDALSLSSINGLKLKRIACISLMADVMGMLGESETLRREAAQLREVSKQEAERAGYFALLVGEEQYSVMQGSSA